MCGLSPHPFIYLCISHHAGTSVEKDGSGKRKPSGTSVKKDGSHACTLSVFSHGMYSVSSINFRLGLSERIELPGLYSWIQVLKH